MAAGSYTRNYDDNSFVFFLEGWLIRHEQFLDELLVAQDTFDEETQEGVIRDLISRVLAHYQEYYEEKSKMSHRNVFHVFSPTWFTPLERTFLWITGFKPGLAFTLVTDSVNDLSENQVQRINRLRYETKVQEKSLADELAKIQESVAAPPLMEMARRVGMQLLHTDGTNIDIIDGDDNIETLKSAMENLVTDADRLRTRTAERVVGVLSPLQSLRFLTAAAQLQLRLRMMGMQREAQRQPNEASNGW
ncbi:PREDICTED: protein DOG1-like 4 [Nicotiana attenuata]|uniref:Transcription factor hbp-1b(C38) n=1 Tax=Nicotiana attenuata TaxID=49451 RepID=A0A1J6IS78_NICAT|nr:PREDICTED: protein DOG1-like 4 [Nicotiana attenuata]OIS98000.1 transcription factor hbp-1b(c38) [Nicotiana attenuata]